MRDFQSDYKLSLSGCNVARAFYEARGYETQDLTRTFDQQQKGDLVVTSGLRCLNVEVKTDTHETGNIILEPISNQKTASPGWFSEQRLNDCDVLFYSFPRGRIILIYPYLEFRDWFFKNLKKLIRNKVAVLVVQGTASQGAVPLNYCVNIEKLSKLCKYVYEIDETRKSEK